MSHNFKNEVFIDYEDDYNNHNMNESNDDIEINDENIIKECYIDKVEENKDIGFDLSLLKRDELHVNLIHFDKRMTNSENYKYFSNFKVDVVGGFHAMDDIEIFKKYLKALENKDIPFIVISSGSSGKDVIPICKKYSFIKEVIIFCGNYEYNKHYIEDYPGYVKKVFITISSVYTYIKSFKNQYDEGIKNYMKSDHFIFSPEDIKMNRQLEQCPVISAFEYDKCYFLVHKAYAHFFGNKEDMNDKYKKVEMSQGDFQIIENYIEGSKIIENKYKDILKEKFDILKKNQDNFVEYAIRLYTGESCFCYLFNKVMRNFEEGLMSLAYYMGPLLFGLNKYVKEKANPFGFRENMTLYRNIECSKLDFYSYQINLNHIICFPSLTSTSTVRGKFLPTAGSKSLNNKGISADDLLKVTLIFDYKHESGNISPGIIVKNYKGKDNKPLSSHPSENEVILFPFTFARIKKITQLSENNTYEMNLELINRKEYIEYTLKNDFDKRIRFSKMD